MRSLRTILAALVVASPLALVGCNDTAKVEDQRTISTPSGESTITKTTEVESSGSNPPIDVSRDANTSPTTP